MIELKSVSKIFTGDVLAVDSVSLKVEKGETVALIGTSGSGKTTCMKLINRLLEPTSGCVEVDGKNVLDFDVIRLRRSIGYVIQRGGLFPHLTVEQNIGLLCRLEEWDKAKTGERVRHLLKLVSLPYDEYGKRYPRELSGGQQQRVGVARALALDPDYLLMDEPFGALDPIARDDVQEEFLRLKRDLHKTIVLVTHDLPEAFKLADRIALMNEGKLIQVGSKKDFLENPLNDFVQQFLTDHFSHSGANS